jgi:hypothetical protein
MKAEDFRVAYLRRALMVRSANQGKIIGEFCAARVSRHFSTSNCIVRSLYVWATVFYRVPFDIRQYFPSVVSSESGY